MGFRIKRIDMRNLQTGKKRYTYTTRDKLVIEYKEPWSKISTIGKVQRDRVGPLSILNVKICSVLNKMRISQKSKVGFVLSFRL